ncbi:MAG: tRNA 4-thiouridine(8) synthase ThiI [Spirochaetales bacterium]|nr:tRNA 4-thiouridine(8) synthase ThiI [Spirochaetales bacterium]
MGELFLIKPGELTLKGKNRRFFEDRLFLNIRRKLKDVPYSWVNRYGRMYLEAEESCVQAVEHCLRTTPGITGFSRAIRCPKDPVQLVEAALSLAESLSVRGNRFKVEAKREDKQFPLTSYQIACLLGAELQKRFPELKVDLTSPSWTLFVEIRDQAYLYVEGKEGLRGLPVGTGGKGILLLSGGIDSPVAGFLMAVRGMVLEAVYFHSPPYTGEQALHKVETLAQHLSQITGSLTLHIVPFTEVQIAIRERGVEDEITLMTRASMMKIATRLAHNRNIPALITGESLGQVASQTVESIRFTNGCTDLPVFRPLIGMNKEWIMNEARKIGTYETSILPYEDCCVLFSPPHPLTRPDPELLAEHFNALNLEDLIEKALNGIDRKAFYYKKE